MKTAKYLNNEALMQKGAKALYRSLGPVEMRRFIKLAARPDREDSLKWHGKWQAKLKKDAFFAKVFPGT